MEKKIRNKGFILNLILGAIYFSLLILISYAQAMEAVSQGKSGLPPESSKVSIIDNIIGMGSASVLKSVDQEEAKEKALEMARNEAILKVVGLYVSPEIGAKEKENLLRLIKGEKDKIIDEYKIVSEETGGEGIYRVKIAARIKEETVKAILYKNLPNDRAIVITSEKNQGKALKKHVLEHELIGLIKKKGYAIVDYRTIKNETRLKLISSIRAGDTESVKKLGLYYLTDLVVVGFVESEFSQKTRDIYSAKATGQVKIHRISDKKELSSLTRFHEKGFGSDEEKAGIDAIRKVSVKMAEEAVMSLPRKVLTKIKVTIQEIGNYLSFKKVKDLIARMPQVKKVQEGFKDFDVEEISLYLKTTEGADYVAKKMSETNLFVVKRVTPSEITLEARRI